ncbi:hypothetical protein TanjilG_07903 [Lupinus angustifolius]|uniref:CUE domain-containing protein n=1 Tax=Lupinus angustifolius TaxID=3871 RepID=A0A1J7G802_LUPAN|nr:PREDICTED: polyadenylate-binding protein-interacting protein 5 [Lupinus angustifolius]XP_019416517.1 PREDICTED: polyadenylate-binding protein-interacting protein 5 [Lupinus angustifolius]XP_019416518.1 PREDICTED: polyadenylate-binding protein-interacting protein 5 [Lupinus angustifolius]XP_019416519.1 PREDICTED: polyadenylate-binding protein-interacting protein 5 [Lupinus angustifolius]XP_019416520.1 PREDICTED: polyadenylate-binding protein-interacting protein 5 [Lupinus angustifolius]OIV96
MSSLNPYAASYVPLSKRESAGRTLVTDKGSENHSSKKMTGNFQTNSQFASNSYGSSSQNRVQSADNHFTDDDHIDLDIEYMKMSFPGISEESLRDVYLLSRDDLDAAIDMLSQLEFDHAVESSGSLPETLDIGDVSEPTLSADSASLKLKNVAAEATISSNPLAPSKLS